MYGSHVRINEIKSCTHNIFSSKVAWVNLNLLVRTRSRKILEDRIVTRKIKRERRKGKKERKKCSAKIISNKDLSNLMQTTWDDIHLLIGHKSTLNWKTYYFLPMENENKKQFFVILSSHISDMWMWLKKKQLRIVPQPEMPRLS